ncbi:MAG: hypothetical protein ACFFF9_07895 [Candidatus Thorarchaeota archaeon]
MVDERQDTKFILLLLVLYALFWIIDFDSTMSLFRWVLNLSLLALIIIGFLYFGNKYIQLTRMSEQIQD